MFSRENLLYAVLTTIAYLSNVAGETSTNDYTPSNDVKQGHNLIHWSPVDGGGREIDYVLSAAFPAIVITIIGIVSVVIFQLTLIGRFCMRSYKCCGVSKTTSSYRGNLMIFGALLLVCLINLHMLFIGNSGINDGLIEAADGLGTLGTEFESLKANSVTLTTLGGKIQSDSASCVGANDCAQYYCCSQADCDSNSSPDTELKPMFAVFDTQGTLVKGVGDSLYSLVKSVPDALDSAESVLRGPAVESKNLVIYIVYAVLLFVLVGYAASAYFKRKIGTQVMILISELIVILLTICCGVCMFLVTVLGDFCMDPSGIIIDVVTETSNSTQLLDLLNYYLNCIGSSPIGSDLDDGIEALGWVVGNITAEAGNLASGQNAQQCQSEINSISSQSTDSIDTLNSLLSIFGCSTINNAWSKIVNEGLCTSGFSGFYALWIALYLVSLCLFFLMCIGAILFKQYEYQAEGYNEDGEISFDANDQAFLDDPGIQFIQNPDGTVTRLDPQQAENFDSVYDGKPVGRVI